jgi:hypothetical protein
VVVVVVVAELIGVGIRRRIDFRTKIRLVQVCVFSVNNLVELVGTLKVTVLQ